MTQESISTGLDGLAAGITTIHLLPARRGAAPAPRRCRSDFRRGRFRQRLRLLGPIILAAFCCGNAYAQGTLINGWLHTGTIAPTGDADSWTFPVNIGDRIVIRVGEITQTNSFTPRIRLQNPSAVQIASASGAVAAEIAVTATNSGTFSLIVDDAVGTTATGTYRLSLAQSPAAVFVAPGDEGGGMASGAEYSGTNPVGDLDVWTFTANAGDGIVLRMGTDSYNPYLRLYGPDGVLVGQAFDGSSGVRDADLRIQATNSGTFTLVASSLTVSAAGSYILTLAHVPEAITVSPGDQGGAMTNGYQHTGTIDVGDLDVWRFSANAGDAIVLRMGSVGYNPLIRLFGPNGAFIGQASDGSSGVRDADLRIQATNSGTFTVVVGSLFENGTGPYILTLAHVPEAITVSPGDRGGAMTNSYQHAGTIDIGDLDMWSFSANAGDAIVLRMGSVGYNPWTRLFGPNGAFIGQVFDSSSGVRDADLRIQATNSGTFTVVVGSLFKNGTGPYILTLAHSPEAITVSPGDQGGALTNGYQHAGTIDIGDLDMWSFSANAGDAIVLRMGSVGYNPWIRLFGPNGAFIGQAFDSSSGVRDTDLRIQATNSGTFTVVVGSLFQNGTGPYILTLAHSPEAITVSPGDQGGAMTNGYQHAGTIDIGDLDMWSFSANAGDAIVLRVGSTGYNPWIRLFGPNGAFIGQAFDSSSGVRDSELWLVATNSGAFTVVAGSFSQNGTGPYLLTLARSPAAIVVSPGDQGGAMTNGFRHAGFLEIGDLDVWNFSANAGNGIALRMGTTNAYNPWIRLFSPSGVLLAQGYDSSSGIRDADLRIQATNSGTFTVVVGSLYENGTGYYILTLGRSPGTIVVSPGDEGGLLTNAVHYSGTVDVGDLDMWNFPACRGSLLSLTCAETSGGAAFTPRLRLFGPTGALLATVQNATLSVLNYHTTNSGTFTLLVDGASLNNKGAYDLSGTGFAQDGLRLCEPLVSGANLDITGIGGMAGASGILYSTTNVAALLATWTPLVTNAFDQYGVFVHTNPFSKTDPRLFFILRQE